MRSSLVISEIALALVLLVGMTLCARSLEHASKVDLGLDPNQIWVAGFRLPPTGYDDNFVLNSGGKSLAVAARVFEPRTGRVMEVLTSEPGVHNPRRLETGGSDFDTPAGHD